jgi:hypothetical protein
LQTIFSAQATSCFVEGIGGDILHMRKKGDGFYPKFGPCLEVACRPEVFYRNQVFDKKRGKE